MSFATMAKSAMRNAAGRHALLSVTQVPGTVTVEIQPIARNLTRAELVVFNDRGVAIVTEVKELRRPRMAFQLVAKGFKLPMNAALVYPKFVVQQDVIGKGFMITAESGNVFVKWRWGTSWYNWFTGRAIGHKFVVTLT